MGNYLWVLALIAAWRQSVDDEPPGPLMARVDAQAGQLRQPEANAANDLAAFLLILRLIRWQLSAIWLAKLLVFRSQRLNLVANPWQPEISPEPAPFLTLARFSPTLAPVPKRSPPHTGVRA